MRTDTDQKSEEKKYGNGNSFHEIYEEYSIHARQFDSSIDSIRIVYSLND